MSVLANVDVEPILPPLPPNPDNEDDNVHTVSFLMTDGDNLQWLLGSFCESASWYNSTQRGSVNLGWTISPSLVELAPTVMNYIYRNAHRNASSPGLDDFVASPSGLGYNYPDTVPNLNNYVNLTGSFMRKASLRLVNVIAEQYSQDAVEEFAQSDDIDGIFYYLYSNYAGLNGSISFVNKSKPIIGGRFNLWPGVFEDPISLAQKLNALPKTKTSANGYSLIPVHVWNVPYSSVIQCISLLGPNVRVVTPTHFVELIKANLGPQ